MPMKLGRKPRIHDPRMPKLDILRRDLKLTTVKPPSSVNWLETLPDDLGMMLNDALGDCTIAALYHSLQVWTGNAKPPVWTNPDADVLKAYEQWCGYNPDDPGTDQGGIIQQVLMDWVNIGLPTGKRGPNQPRQHLTIPVEINPGSLTDIQLAIYDCATVDIGFEVPAYIMNNGPPAVWDVDPSGDQTIVGGHSVVVSGYSTNFNLISWGSKYQMTWAFWQKYVDEAYALVDKEWVEATGKTPLGMTLGQLKTAAEVLGSS